MDKQLATRIVDTIEDLFIERLALKGIIFTFHPNWPEKHIDDLVQEAKDKPELRKIVREQLKRLRDKLESDSDLEGAIQAFLKVAPPAKDMN